MLEHSLRVARAWGMLIEDEVFALSRVVSGLPQNALCVNIGAGTGTSGLTIAETRPDVEIWTIDNEIETPFGGLQNERNVFKEADLPFPNQILSDSSKAVRQWRKKVHRKLIDLLIIDGDHSEEGVTKDIKAWLPFVRPDGIVMFHDYGTRVNETTDVSRVVDRLMVNQLQLGHVGLYIWFQIRR